MKITLIGTLGKFSDKGTCIVGVMQHTGEKFPALPKGVPAPQPTKTNYVVYIGQKQWKNVAAAAGDPEDALIIEGFPQIDTQTGAISVFASNVTSSLRHQASGGQATSAITNSWKRSRYLVYPQGVNKPHPDERQDGMTAQDDQDFYEKKELLLRRVQEGKATPEEKGWLIRLGFLEKPKLTPTQPSPTQTNRVSRYRQREATPLSEAEGAGGPGIHTNRYRKLVADPKWKRVRRKRK